SRFERDPFPESFYVIEGSEGSISLSYENWLTITTRQGVEKIKADPPVLYDWVNPDYALVHCSIVDCNRDMLRQLRGEGISEMLGADNFETARLVWAAYESAKTGQVVDMNQFD
ncbi:MAG: gfo/Idh/MocA family oxidoreductase, partial [Sphingobacteriaceae bacterium]|nr:gfo/Idh/MocA family oxidoreductase [Cytophagaceae bacterium]